MARYADSLARQKRIKPPPGYRTSMSICREFLNQHAPVKSSVNAAGRPEADPLVSGQIENPESRDQESASASPVAVFAQSDAPLAAERSKRPRKSTSKPLRSVEPGSVGAVKPLGKRKAGEDARTKGAAAPPVAARNNTLTVTPLRIPYGNKDVALRLGARYGSAGWYAPLGVDLTAFGERGWI
jgi:DNA topoisomerase-3